MHSNNVGLHVKTHTWCPAAQEDIHTHLRLFEPVLQVTEVHVFVAQPLCPTQTDPINDGGMVQLIRQHCVIWAQQDLV